MLIDTLKNKKGFTLIELLVVISIISLLSSVVLAGLNSARAKARDSKRISELKQLQTALEFYYDKYGAYPQASAGGFASDWNSCISSSSYHTALAPLMTAGFISKLPMDPVDRNSGTPRYCYWYFTHTQDAFNCGGNNTPGDPLYDIADTYQYTIYFSTEATTLSYPPGRPSGTPAKYCIPGPKK